MDTQIIRILLSITICFSLSCTQTNSKVSNQETVCNSYSERKMSGNEMKFIKNELDSTLEIEKFVPISFQFCKTASNQQENGQLIIKFNNELISKNLRITITEKVFEDSVISFKKINNKKINHIDYFHNLSTRNYKPFNINVDYTSSSIYLYKNQVLIFSRDQTWVGAKAKDYYVEYFDGDKLTLTKGYIENHNSKENYIRKCAQSGSVIKALIL